MKLVKRGKTLDVKKHNIGKSPNQKALNSARENLLHHTIYNRCRELLNYSGTPDQRRVSSDYFQVNGGYNCDFYIIWPTRGETGDKIRVGYAMNTWDNYDSATNCNFQWDGVASTNLANIATPNADATQDSTYSLTSTKKPNGIQVIDDKELDYNHNDFSGYSYTRVSFEHLQPASFVSWISSEYESDFNDDPPTNDKAFNLSDSNFNIGQVVRGADSIGDGNGSVGTLCQRQFNDGTAKSSMINNSDLCLFQHGHPSGIYTIGTSASFTDEPVYVSPIKIKGRSLKNNTTGYMDVALVYRADAGTSLKLTVDSTGTTHTKSFTATATTALVAFNDIPFDPTGDEITVEINCTNALAVEIKTLAFFEVSD
jgi:hypothetical protein